MSKKRKPGRPKGDGSHVVSFRVTDAKYAELESEGPSASLAAKRRITANKGEKR